MKLNYKNLEIEIFDGINYTLNSNDSLREYKKIHFKNIGTCHKNSHTIIIKESGIEISSALIYQFHEMNGIYNDSFILEDDKIWIINYNEIYCLHIPSLELAWHKEFDSHVNIAIHKLKDDIIIHGESEIFRITKAGEIVWSFGGRDIWFNVEGEPEITIENNTIRLFDFVSNEYVLDFDGNQIEDNPRIIQEQIKKKWWQIFG